MNEVLKDSGDDQPTESPRSTASEVEHQRPLPLVRKTVEPLHLPTAQNTEEQTVATASLPKVDPYRPLPPRSTAATPGRKPLAVDLPRAKAKVTFDNIAGLNLRSLISAIDFSISCVLLSPLVMASRHWWGLDSMINPTTFAGELDILSMINTTIYVVLFFAWGAIGVSIFAALPMFSPGNRWTGVSVVDATTGRDPAAFRLFLRAIVALIDNVFLFSMGSMLMLFDKRRQGLRDKVARTVVIVNKKDARFPW